MTVPCIGVGSEVFDENDNLIGEVGFWDYDKFLEKDILEKRISELSRAVNTGVWVLETQFGYHILTFEILNEEKLFLWESYCKKLFPSDYFNRICDKCGKMMKKVGETDDGKITLKCDCGYSKTYFANVLRVSQKGEQNKPSFVTFCEVFKGGKRLSFGHIKVYRDSGILPDYFPLPEHYDFELVNSKVNLCEYPAEIKEN